MMARMVLMALAVLALAACGEERSASNGSRTAKDKPKIQETEPSVREGVSREQLEYMQEFSAAYDGDDTFETCFAQRVESMEPVPRSTWPQLAGGMAAECAGTAPEHGPIE